MCLIVKKNVLLHFCLFNYIYHILYAQFAIMVHQKNVFRIDVEVNF